jgi:hypothetical protein
MQPQEHQLVRRHGGCSLSKPIEALVQQSQLVLKSGEDRRPWRLVLLDDLGNILQCRQPSLVARSSAITTQNPQGFRSLKGSGVDWSSRRGHVCN